tara:strand:- start:305 stop:475 length:171 start_codon:yes stop_codon:yes gene_type:complete
MDMSFTTTHDMSDWTKEQHRKFMISYLLQQLMKTKNYQRKAELIEEFALNIVDNGW